MPTIIDLVSVLICFLIGLSLIVTSIRTLVSSVRLRTKGIFVWGLITERTGNDLLIDLIVSFSSLDDQHCMINRTGLTSSGYSIGDEVAVLYNPDDPWDANIYTADFLWIYPVCKLLFGGFILLAIFSKYIPLIEF